MTVLVLLGAPGSGKGTQSLKIANKFGLKHISTGMMFRENISKDTPLGKKAQEYIEKGRLVPDEITNKMVEEYLTTNNFGNGVILDGYPRNINQANVLKGILKKIDSKVDLVININIEEDVIIERLSHRRECSKCSKTYSLNLAPTKVEGVCDDCGGKLVVRKDDNPETIKHRIAVYHNETAPLIDYYKNEKLLEDVNGSKGVEELFKKVSMFLEGLK